MAYSINNYTPEGRKFKTGRIIPSNGLKILVDDLLGPEEDPIHNLQSPIKTVSKERFKEYGAEKTKFPATHGENASLHFLNEDEPYKIKGLRELYGSARVDLTLAGLHPGKDELNAMVAKKIIEMRNEKDLSSITKYSN